MVGAGITGASEWIVNTNLVSFSGGLDSSDAPSSEFSDRALRRRWANSIAYNYYLKSIRAVRQFGALHYGEGRQQDNCSHRVAREDGFECCESSQNLRIELCLVTTECIHSKLPFLASHIVLLDFSLLWVYSEAVNRGDTESSL